VEGPRGKIEELISRLKGQFGSFIRETQVEWLEDGVKKEYDEFTII